MIKLLSFFLITLALPSFAEIVWERDFERAALQAKSENKPLLLFFTGSDWSGWSMKMKKEILGSKEFAEKIQGRFVCVEIDFPEHKKEDAQSQSKNAALKERFKIHDYPRLVILSMQPNEREIARFGYPEESAEKFAKDLVNVTEKDKALDVAIHPIKDSILSTDLFELYRLATELKRNDDARHILNHGVARGNLTFLLEKYRLLVEEGKGGACEAIDLRQRLDMADPKNEKGIQFSLCLIDFQQNALNLGEKSPLAAKPLEEYLNKFGEQDKENRWRIEMMIAQVYLNFDEWKNALKHAELAYNAAPKERKGEILHALDSMRKEAKLASK